MTPRTPTASATWRWRSGARLYVFFTAIGDAPERVLASTIDLTPGQNMARLAAHSVLQPEGAV